ncbi:MAG: hypothetical protein ABEJ44_03275 [Halanaeroarchaeum sp.]
MTDRGVSEVLGYVLVFSLVMGTVGVVYTTGLGGLHEVREAEKIANAERAFDVLDSNIADLTSGEADARGTEIQLAGATLGFAEPVVVNVSVENGGSYRGVIRPIYFSGSNENTRIVASNGAVFRQQDETAVLLNEPAFVFGDRHTVIPLVMTRTRDSGRSGSGRILVRTTVADRSVVRLSAPGSTTVTVTIESPRAGAWAEYLEDATGSSCTVTGNVTTCSVDTDVAYVQIVRVDVSFV